VLLRPREFDFSLRINAAVSPTSSPLGRFRKEERLRRKICRESGQELWLVDIEVYIVSAYCLQMTNKRQKAMKVKCKLGRKRDESTSFRIYSSLEAASVFRNWTQTFTIVDQEKHKIKQIYIWNPMTTGFIM